MKRILAAVLLASAAPAAFADSLETNLSDQALRAMFAGALSELFGSVEGVYELGVLTGEEEDSNRDFTQVHGALLVTGDAGAEDANVTAGLGVRLAGLDADAISGGAFALGGMLEARLPAFNRIGFVLYAYGAPSASTFGDLDGYVEYAAALDYQVLRNASIYTGYRQLKIDVEEAGDATVDNGWHVGLRLSF